jgi:GH35 family endo-1,4-beta-xylanase
MTVERLPPEVWSAQVRARSEGPVRAGDVLHVRATVACVAVDPQTDEAVIQLVAQATDPPWDGGDEALFFLRPGEQELSVALRVERDFAAGGLQLAVNFGFARQEIELQSMDVSNLGPLPPADAARLRRPAPTYAGRSPDAPWRQAAAERIERVRKADLRVRVTDANGDPLAGARVRARQTDHAFMLGTAVVARRIVGDRPDDQAYRDTLKAHFNSAVFENDMKWVAWEEGSPAQRREHRERTRSAVRWLREHGLRVRGHTLVWPGYGARWPYLPPDIREKVNARDATGLRRRVAAHVADIAGAFRGDLEEWDVVNEPVDNRVLQSVLGEAALVEWFHLARAADPSARLYLNDFTMLSYGALSRSRSRQFHDNVRFLLDSGAPLDGIGEQAHHVGDRLVGIGRVLAELDRFAQFGLPIRLTEFDIDSEDRALQADYLRDFYTAAFSHQAVNGVLMWGFWARHHWKPQAALWADDWSTRPHAQAYLDLRRAWTTDATGVSGTDGTVSVRGFHGAYDITAEHDGATARR